MSDQTKLLVVEDDATSMMILTKILETEGYNVVGVEEGQGALDALVDHPDIKLVLLDWVLPGMDGISVLDNIRQRDNFNELPVVMTTSNHTIGEVKQAVAAGADDYLVKPLDQEKTLKKVEHWLTTGRVAK